MKAIVLAIVMLSAVTFSFIHAEEYTDERLSSVNREILDHFMDSDAKELFKVYHFLFKKEYDLNSKEGVNRYRVFKANLKEIKETNSKNHSFKVGVNQFTDLTKEEFSKLYTIDLKKMQDIKTQLRFLENKNNFVDFDKFSDDENEIMFKNELTQNFTMPDTDWRSFVPRVRDQGKCGCCYAMATIDAYSANYAVSGKGNVLLSSQHVVDCSTNTFGCNGGYPTNLLNWAITNGFVAFKDYKGYVQLKKNCTANPNSQKYKPTGYDSYSFNKSNVNGSLTNFYQLLAKGPLAVIIDGDSIYSYKSGIFDSSVKGCYNQNHVVVVTGYEKVTDAQGVVTEVLTVKNSWGTDWGEKGYMRMKVNANATAYSQTCFVLNQAWRPLA
jgi:C1A family cysteine protease